MALKVIGIIFLVLIVITGSFALWALNYHKKLKAVPINNIDLSKVKDGTYEGKWDIKMWTMPVQITVANHKIVDAKISEKSKNPGKKVGNEFLARVVKQQSLEVDAIAGSTITTKAILKSAELALAEGLN